MQKKHSIGRIAGRIGLVMVDAVAVTAGYLFWPVSANALPSHPNPVSSYDEAFQRIAAIQAQETNLNPLCKTQLLTHGQKARRVYILVHGYTNCTAQYVKFAPRLFDQDSNVLLVPLPRHGLAERMNEDQSQLTALELAAYADRVVDIAQGLGDQVVMLGFSLGGVTTAWAAQNRSDIYRAVVISPPFGFKIVPAWLTIAAMRAYMVLPNSYTWWDPVNKDIPTIQTYTYPRYASRTLAQALKIGFNVLANARQSPFKAGSVQVITNANDELVSLEMIAQLTSSWKKLAPEKVSTYELPASQKIKHDLFDPEQTEVDVVSLAYPKLLELATAP